MGHRRNINDVFETPEEMKQTFGATPEEEAAANEPTEKVVPPAAPAAQPAAAPSGFIPTYIGGKRFESADDLAAYTSELQTKTTQYEAERQFAPVSPAMQNANQPKVSDLMFTDPEAFAQVIQENAEKRVMDKINATNSQQQKWNKFYKDYPELQGADFAPMVEAQFNIRKNSNPNLPAEQLLDTIGKDMRSFVSKVRGKPEGGKELPNAAAVVASASNNIPGGKPPVQAEPDDMASQLRRHQKRGR